MISLDNWIGKKHTIPFGRLFGKVSRQAESSVVVSALHRSMHILAGGES